MKAPEITFESFHTRKPFPQETIASRLVLALSPIFLGTKVSIPFLPLLLARWCAGSVFTVVSTILRLSATTMAVAFAFR